jgi:hypothetical protein
VAGEDPEYITWVRQQACLARLLPGYAEPCVGAVQAHHAGKKGVGMRAHDDTAIPLCLRHHQNWHDANGVFKGWGKSQRSEWAESQIEAVRRRFDKPRPDWF